MSVPDVETPISALVRIDHAEAMDLTVVEHDRLYTVLDQLNDDDWSRPTDCPGWDVRAVAVHLLASAEAQASPKEFIRQLRAGRGLAFPRWRDRANAAQLAGRRNLKNGDLTDLWAAASYRALHARQRIPALLRALRVLPLGEVDGVKLGWKPVGYLYGIGFTRCVWMHRVDLARATGRELQATPEHDGRIIADLVAEWATTHPEPFTLRLRGPAGGKFVRDPQNHGEIVDLDAVEFARVLAGRGNGAGVLRHRLPLV